ncbi:Polycystic kidney disease 1 like 1 [Dissostichus eleginoides]|uniref:Polycystic kidney disease 1 like 1 n=1 Tax=Dissostichus eleginoides TaxID=100907 RepID=A0AAD9BJW2_DISEL|nr:Polycystic kidney disease 1 like 1 [Dissostichus eleginoides]
MVLKGEDGFSQTRELHVPGCTLFRRNSQDTFIISAADSLGPVWGVHIWHDNSGPSPSWNIKHLDVSEVSRGQLKGRAWLFVAQCWLAVNQSDGRVERILGKCTRGIGFFKTLSLKLSDYLADYHIWISLYSCPCPNVFTHTQRLCVSLLLLLGYACVSTLIISQMDDRLLPFQFGCVEATAVSVRTGVLSVCVVLPAAAVISFLFRQKEVERVQHAKSRTTGKDFFQDDFSVSGSISEPHLSWSVLQLWAQDSWRKKYQGTDLPSVSPTIQENKITDKEPEITTLCSLLLINEGDNANQTSPGKEFGTGDGGQEPRSVDGGSSDGSLEEDVRLKGGGFRSQCCLYLAWTLCLLMSLCCLVLSAVLGMRFSSSKVLLWMHSLFFSLVFCIFIIQPALISAVAVVVSFWFRNRSDFHTSSSIREFENLQSHDAAFPQDRGSYLEQLLGARQRVRFLRLVHPPTPAELRKTRGKKRRETLIQNTLRDLSVCGSMLLLMLCISYGDSFTDHYQLNEAVRKQFTRGHDNAFMSIQKHEDWWLWAQKNLLHSLYKNSSSTEQSHILIGEPILWREESSAFQRKVSSVTLVPESLLSFWSGIRSSSHKQTKDSVPPGTFGQSASVGLGHTKSAAASNLRLLQSDGWLDGHTVSLHFTLFSPAPNLFTSVTLQTEQSPPAVLLSSARVQSVGGCHSPAVGDYGQFVTVSLVYYIYYIYRSVIVLEVVELLHKHSYRGHVDVSLLATWEQCIRSLHGVTLFLLTMKCVTVLRVNSSDSLLTRSLCSLLWPTISCVILMVALSCAGNLLFVQSSSSFSSLPRSFRTLLRHCWGLRALRGLHRSERDLLYRGLLFLSSGLRTAVVIGVMSSLVRRAKRSGGRGNVLTMAELSRYIRRKISEVTCQQRQAWTENHVEGKTYYFEEFESLLDELLFRLSALSNSLHQTLPSKAHRYRKDSPALSHTQRINMHAQDFVRTQEENPTCISPAQLELEDMPFLQQRNQRGGCPFSDVVVGLDNSQQPGTRAGENPKDQELQTYLKTQNYPSRPETLIRVWTEDVLEKQSEPWTEINDTTQAPQTEMVVEVLVHEEPGRVEPDQ